MIGIHSGNGRLKIAGRQKALSHYLPTRVPAAGQYHPVRFRAPMVCSKSAVSRVVWLTGACSRVIRLHVDGNERNGGPSKSVWETTGGLALVILFRGISFAAEYLRTCVELISNYMIISRLRKQCSACRDSRTCFTMTSWQGIAFLISGLCVGKPPVTQTKDH